MAARLHVVGGVAFDAAAWLELFVAAGGGYIVDSDGRVLVGYPLSGPIDNEKPRVMIMAMMKHADRRAAVKAAILEMLSKA